MTTNGVRRQNCRSEWVVGQPINWAHSTSAHARCAPVYPVLMFNISWWPVDTDSSLCTGLRQCTLCYTAHVHINYEIFVIVVKILLPVNKLVVLAERRLIALYHDDIISTSTLTACIRSIASGPGRPHTWARAVSLHHDDTHIVWTAKAVYESICGLSEAVPDKRSHGRCSMCTMLAHGNHAYTIIWVWCFVQWHKMTILLEVNWKWRLRTSTKKHTIISFVGWSDNMNPETINLYVQFMTCSTDFQ